MERVDSVVTGEAEGVWSQVLGDARNGNLKRRYDGGLAEISDVPVARHDLPAGGYACGAIQTTRGCPLNCSFCSVTAFNGAHYRQRSIADVVREFQLIREKTCAGGGRQSHRHAPQTHRSRQEPVPRHGAGEPAKEMDRSSRH